MRLDKFIGHASELSRARIHNLIKQGAVSINAEIACKGAQQIDEEDIVTLHGERLLPARVRYLMLHKPLGYICANNDSEHPVVLDLIQEPSKKTLQIVGRLDIDTTGLVLITDDGQWNHRVTSPKSDCAKVYRVKAAEPITDAMAELFRVGILLHGEKKPTQPALLERLDSCSALLTINEGKYHQVKRMFAAAGNRVIELHRHSIGGIQLDPELEPGQYRTLNDAEIKSI